jgi:hypothetical protein
MGTNEAAFPEQVPRLLRMRERREELFKMSQKEDETLEDFVE